LQIPEGSGPERRDRREAAQTVADARSIDSSAPRAAFRVDREGTVMLRRLSFAPLASHASIASLAWLLLAVAARGDELVLAGGSVVRGPVLKESSDALFVDLGFTVLSVPRTSILQRRSDAEAAAPTAGGESQKGLYSRASLAELAVKELVERFGEGVVLIKSPSALGSGFIIREDGNVVTNAHVVQGETQLTITVFRRVEGSIEKKVYEKVKILAVNPVVDFALLKIDATELGDAKLTKVFLGDAEELKVG